MLTKTFALLALAGSALASPLIAQRAQCTDAYRAAQLNGVAPAFSDMRVGATAQFLQQLPLKSDAQLILYINGSPGVTVAPNSALVRDFALGVRQVFYRVYPTSVPATTNFPNGTSHTELEIELGPRFIALPVDIHAGMNFNYDLSDCLIRSLEGFLTIPSQINGVPVDVTAVTKQLFAAGYAGVMPTV